MWGNNIIEEIQRIVTSNPYVAYIAGSEHQKERVEKKETPEIDHEELELSEEAMMLDPAVNIQQNEGEHRDQGDQEPSEEELLEEIDRKVTELLSRLLLDQQYTLIALEHFNRTKELYFQGDTASSTRPSMKVLELLSREKRLPEEFRLAFRGLLAEYHRIIRLKDRSNLRNIAAAWRMIQ